MKSSTLRKEWILVLCTKIISNNCLQDEVNITLALHGHVIVLADVKAFLFEQDSTTSIFVNFRFLSSHRIIYICIYICMQYTIVLIFFCIKNNIVINVKKF